MTAYADHLGGSDTTVGLLLAAIPFGTVCGAIICGRFTSAREPSASPSPE